MNRRISLHRARVRLLIASSRGLLIVIAVVVWSGSVGAQATRPWQVALGIGATTGEPVGDGAAVIAEIGRSLYATPRMTLDLRLTAAHLRTTDRFVCFSDQCDLRELADAAGLGLAATAGLFASENTPYIAGSVGAWTGRASNRSPDQTSAQSGALLAAEAGYRVKQFEFGLGVHQLDGSVRSVVRLASIAIRARF
jgi:hypothetical protein